MKISELIAELKRIQKEKGDLVVHIMDSEYGDRPISSVEAEPHYAIYDLELVIIRGR